jgi:hypothetical protein
LKQVKNVSHWETLWVIPPISRFQIASLSGRKRQKRGRKMRKSAPCQHSKSGEKMKRKKAKRKQQGCDVAKVIDGFEQAVSTAKKVYRAVEPIVKTIVAHRRKTK